MSDTPIISECDVCGFRTTLTAYPRSKLCALCANTTTGNLPNLYSDRQSVRDDEYVLRTVCYVGNAILDAIRNQCVLSSNSSAPMPVMLPNEVVAGERFLFNREEFQRHLSLRSVDLNTGVSVVGPADRFDEYVSRERVDDDSQAFRFTTRGRIVAERLKKGR